MEPRLVIQLALCVVAGWLALGCAGLAHLRRTRVVAHGLFPAGALLGVLLFGIGLYAMHGPAATLVLPPLPSHTDSVQSPSL